MGSARRRQRAASAWQRGGCVAGPTGGSAGPRQPRPLGAARRPRAAEAGAAAPRGAAAVLPEVCGGGGDGELAAVQRALVGRVQQAVQSRAVAPVLCRAPDVAVPRDPQGQARSSGAQSDKVVKSIAGADVHSFVGLAEEILSLTRELHRFMSLENEALVLQILVGFLQQRGFFKEGTEMPFPNFAPMLTHMF
eukprot:CAMPEP_0179091366 /NCGR_PEP_ID=MMETSP0796-20121207/41734_1 /TAXON_ID=73915 /ORGANISM="Pyrodinium bahamense, Strain pbaha01" /LENGTH=192 /DNA_ID=CAMNT_0020788957 /DNA_START=29 /DNA_END=608 /DNA_ORIENTATION=+